MHRLEREAQDDPFLMDALEGYGLSNNDQQDNLAELQQRLADRVAPKKERSILLWRVLPIAASLLIALTIGYMLFKPTSDKQKAAMPLVSSSTPPAPADKVNVQPDSAKKTVSASSILAQNHVPVHHHLNRPQPVISAPENVVGAISSIKDDTAAYTARNNAFYKKGNNNAANVGQNIQMVDSYGDQAAIRGGNKWTGANKEASDTAKTLTNALAGRVAGLSANKKELNEVTIVGYGSVQKREVTGSVATISARDTVAQTMRQAKITSPIDSTMYLAEVVVPGYADKAKSPTRPADGWKNYLTYIKQEAVMPDNSVGKVMLAFKIGKDGLIYGIRILKGSTMAINQKAIEILKNGPAWIGSSVNKEIKLKIKFHKGD